MTEAQPTYTAKRVVISLLYLRAAIATGETSIQDETQKHGADRALTMAIEDWRALIKDAPEVSAGVILDEARAAMDAFGDVLLEIKRRESLTPPAESGTMDTSQKCGKGAV